MGLVKKELFSPELNEIAVLFKTLGHPARIAILEYLIKSETCVNNDLVEEIGLAQSTISQHLKELKNIGLIQGTIDGPRMNYCINTQMWKDYQKVLFDFWDIELQKNKCC